ncbi:MAG: hypothetical protein Q9223_005767, partial [Gallowayella weberi]
PAAAALSSLDSQHTVSDEPSKTKNIDQEALAKAISRLELSTGAKGVESTELHVSEKERAFREKRRMEREERERVAKVKVDGGDVTLLVSAVGGFRRMGGNDCMC